MQITSCQVLNNKYIQLYLTQEELEEEKTKEIIEKYKKEKYKIGIFITGKENYLEILKRIIEKQIQLDREN